MPSPLTKLGVTTSVMRREPYRPSRDRHCIAGRRAAAVRDLEQAGGGGERDREAGGTLVDRLEVVLREAGAGERQRPSDSTSAVGSTPGVITRTGSSSTGSSTSSPQKSRSCCALGLPPRPRRRRAGLTASLVFVGEHGVGADAERGAELAGVEVGQRARLRQHEVGDAPLALRPPLRRARRRCRGTPAGG